MHWLYFTLNSLYSLASLTSLQFCLILTHFPVFKGCICVTIDLWGITTAIELVHIYRPFLVIVLDSWMCLPCLAKVCQVLREAGKGSGCICNRCDHILNKAHFVPPCPDWDLHVWSLQNRSKWYPSLIGWALASASWGQLALQTPATLTSTSM